MREIVIEKKTQTLLFRNSKMENVAYKMELNEVVNLTLKFDQMT